MTTPAGELLRLLLGNPHLPLGDASVDRRLRHPDEAVPLLLVELHPRVQDRPGLDRAGAARALDRADDTMNHLLRVQLADHLGQPGDMAGGAVDLLEQRVVGLHVARQPVQRDGPFRLTALGGLHVGR